MLCLIIFRIISYYVLYLVIVNLAVIKELARIVEKSDIVNIAR